MKLYIERKWPKQDYTIGRLYIDGKFICNTLEPPITFDREMKTTGSGKAIMHGTYKVKLQMSPRFHKVLPRLQDVPGREAILIHSGNTVKDTKGCILVGKNSKVGKVMNSKATLATILELLTKAEKGLVPPPNGGTQREGGLNSPKDGKEVIEPEPIVITIR